MARRSRYSLLTLFRHPLPLVVLPLFVVSLITGLADGSRLLLLEPIALASSAPDVGENGRANPAAMAESEANGRLAELAEANALLRQAHSQLKEFSGGLPGEPATPIPARIIRRGDSSTWRHSIYLNRGRDDGIVPGYAVTVGRTLVGIVTQAGPGVSLVQLITDPGVAVGVSILPSDDSAAREMLSNVARSKPTVSDSNTAKEPTPTGSLRDLSLLKDVGGTSEQEPVVARGGNPSKDIRFPTGLSGTPEEMARGLAPRQRVTRGTLRGHGGSSPRLPKLPIEDVDVDTGVKPGMLVVTNDAAGALPAGLLVGFVSEVSNRNTFLHVEVACALDISLVDVVLVVPHQRPTLDEVSRMLAGEASLDRRK